MCIRDRLNCDPDPLGGKPEGSVHEKVSRILQNIDLKNECLILGLNYRRNRHSHKKNVIWMLKKLTIKAKAGATNIMKWIVDRMTKWKNLIQISLFTALNNVEILNLTIISNIKIDKINKKYKLSSGTSIADSYHPTFSGGKSM